jgi:hypothetical protein
MVQLGQAVAQILAPALAAIMVGMIGLHGAILIDVGSYLVAILTLLLVRIPRPETSDEGRRSRGSLVNESLYGWRYIAARPGLLSLLLFFAVTNFVIGVVMVLMTPMVLSFATSNALGAVLSIAGTGMLVGSIVMSVWGGPRRQVYGVLGAALLMSVCIILAGLRPSTTLIAAAAFGGFFCFPIVAASSQAIWQSKVAPDLQGRVFAIRRMIAWSTLPLAYLVAGPLADRIFNPLLLHDGPLAGSMGHMIGVGPGRGIGLVFIILGTFMALATGAGWLYPRLRLVELEVPDSIGDTTQQA